MELLGLKQSVDWLISLLTVNSPATNYHAESSVHVSHRPVISDFGLCSVTCSTVVDESIWRSGLVWRVGWMWLCLWIGPERAPRCSSGWTWPPPAASPAEPPPASAAPSAETQPQAQHPSASSTIKRSERGQTCWVSSVSVLFLWTSSSSSFSWSRICNNMTTAHKVTF